MASARARRESPVLYTMTAEKMAAQREIARLALEVVRAIRRHGSLLEGDPEIVALAKALGVSQ